MTQMRQPWLAYGILTMGVLVIAILMFQPPEPVVTTNPYQLTDYQNEALGIEFKYPAKLGQVKENYKDENLAEIAFTETDAINLRSTPYRESPNCEGVEYDCRTLTVSSHSITLMTMPETATAPASKVFYVPTKQGIWSFAATDSAYYQDLFNTVSTLKFDQQ